MTVFVFGDIISAKIKIKYFARDMSLDFAYPQRYKDKQNQVSYFFGMKEKKL